ncbi:hypothetical protein NX059_009644 [Plenodomus lindquistii]|nr:hypothetical protein NX059_009644 [Plenodomus lindquistii]
MDIMEREKDALQKELRELRSALAGMEETLDYRQKELERQERKTLKAEKQLEDAHNHIFRLQPRRTDVTEAEAKEMFNDLFNSVQRWVGNRLDKVLDILDQGKLKNREFPRDAARKILALTGARALQSSGLDQIDEHHIIATIMEFIRRSFFDHTFYCPLVVGTEPKDVTPAVNRIEQLMRAVPRDESQCREWRVEALLAMTLEEGFTGRRTRHEHQKTIELFSLLAPLVPNAEPQDLGDSIKRNMIMPAMDLAHHLQLAATTYFLKWTSFNADLRVGNVTSSSVEFSNFTSMNIQENGKVIAPLNKAPSTSSQAISMRYLFDVAPGLYSKPPGIEDITKLKVISKPRVLVHVGNSAPKSGPTLLKWIEVESKRDARLRNTVPQAPSVATSEDNMAKSSIRNPITTLNKKLRK